MRRRSLDDQPKGYRKIDKTEKTKAKESAKDEPQYEKENYPVIK